MKTSRLIKIAYTGLGRNKLRTFLMMIGIVIGITAESLAGLASGAVWLITWYAPISIWIGMALVVLVVSLIGWEFVRPRRRSTRNRA